MGTGWGRPSSTSASRARVGRRSSNPPLGPEAPTWAWRSPNEGQMLLQSYRSFDTLGDYDPATGKLITLRRHAQSHRAGRDIVGVFDELGGSRLLLYRLGGVLYLQVDGQRMPF